MTPDRGPIQRSASRCVGAHQLMSRLLMMGVCTLNLGLSAMAAQVTPADASPAPAAVPASAPASAPARADGKWTGTMRVGGQTLTFRLMLAPPATTPAPTPASTPAPWTATLAIPEQGLADFALSDVIAAEDRVSWRMPGVPGSPAYAGVREGDRIRGTFTQSGASFELIFARGDAPPARVPRPQEPAEPITAYRSEDVAITAPSARLAGTLTLPPGPGPHPAVLLISGSGPQDRNSEIFDHRPFLIWADRLTRDGFAVLRVDDRGVGASRGPAATATTDDLAGDATACVEFLLARPDIRRVALMGHSEGALIAAMLAARSERIDAVVMLAGPGLTGRQTLVAQNRALAIAGGRSEQDAEAIAQAADALFEGIAAENNEPELLVLAKALVARQTARPENDPALQREAASAVLTLRSPWMARFLTIDPAEYLAKVRSPVLAIFGGRDVQVVASVERPAMEAALARSSTRDVTLTVHPTLNHLLQPCQTGSISEYGTIATTIDEAVLAEVTAWLTARLAPNNGAVK